MKNRKFFGFTLSEVLICIVIIGIIMAISMRTIKTIKTSYTSLTYHEYLNIKQIAAEMIAGDRPYEEGVAGITTIMFTESGPKTIITRDDSVFCNVLLDMANAAGTRRCSTDELFSVSNDGTEPSITIPNNELASPTFLSTSGKRYYLSGRVQGDSRVSSKFGYRLLAVDLNGPQAPNISAPSGSLVPDIVTFAILDTGEIFPLGVAANNLEFTKNGKTQRVLYLNSKLKGYYYYDKSDRTTGVPEDCFIKSSDPSKNKQICNYAMIYIPNHTTDESNELAFYTYREAYCASLGDKNSTFNTYCEGLNPEKLCPPSTESQQFDVCRVENVKPVFRFNFK